MLKFINLIWKHKEFIGTPNFCISANIGRDYGLAKIHKPVILTFRIFYSSIRSTLHKVSPFILCLFSKGLSEKSRRSVKNILSVRCKKLSLLSTFLFIYMLFHYLFHPNDVVINCSKNRRQHSADLQKFHLLK